MRPAAILGALVLPALLAAPPLARAVGQAHGTVFDKNRKGVPGLTVAIIPESGSTIHGTSTDERGRYSFKGLEGGTYSVMVRDQGNGIARKDGIRVRSLFRSIVDFNVPGDYQVTGIPGPVPATEPGADADGLTVSWVLVGTDREPTPDSSVTLTPLQGEGRQQHARTGSEGKCVMSGVEPGTYRITAKAPGFMTWVLDPVPLKGPGSLDLTLKMVPFPMGFEGSLEDLLIPADPIPPEETKAADASP